MKWSDGEPATAEDACFSWQLALDAIADGEPAASAPATSTRTSTTPGSPTVECPDDHDA